MSLRRFNMISNNEMHKKTNRQYMRAHRDEWASLGFRNISYMVHDSERDLILAELDVRRCDKLIELAEDRKSDMELLERLSRRNMPKSPDAGTLARLMADIEQSRARQEAMDMVNIAQHMLKKQAGLVALFGREESRDKRIKIAARGVAYSSSAAARFRLAQAIVDYAPLRPMSVFGIEGSVATEEEIAWDTENELKL